MQTWPWCRKAPQAPAELATSMSASSSTMSALLPPSSRLTRFSVRPAASPTRRPTAVEPVKEIIATSGFAASAPPGSASPGSTCSTPAGSPASSNSRAIRTPPDTAVCTSGLSTTALPSASAGATARDGQDLREVPRADHADHAERYPPGDALPAGLAGRQQLAPGLGGQRRRLPQLAEHQLDLERGLAGDGAALADQPALELGPVVLQQPGGPADQRGALRAGLGGPLRLRPLGRGGGRGDVGGVGEADRGEHRAGGRLDGLEHAARADWSSRRCRPCPASRGRRGVRPWCVPSLVGPGHSMSDKPLSNLVTRVLTICVSALA